MRNTIIRDRTKSRARTIAWGEVLISAIGLTIATVLIIGAANMQIRGNQIPGPEFFPLLIAALLISTSGYLLIRSIIPRKRVEQPEALSPDFARHMLTDVSGTDTQVIALEQIQHQAVTDTDLEKGAQTTPAQTAPTTNWKASAIVVGAVAGFIILLQPLGWILSGTLLFAAITYGFGSKRIWFNLAIGIFIVSIVQLVFNAVLGLNLPAGFVGQIF